MTSKTFKSAYAEHGNQKLNIIDVDDGVRVSADHGSHGAKGIIIAPSDAPAVCLAILEAAGAHKDSQDYLGGAVEQLIFHIATTEREAAAEADRVALEAEALKFYNAHRAYSGIPPESSWDGYNETIKKSWLAVARAARELNKEDGQ